VKMTQNQGFTIWFTGMACTGKTMLANYVSARLRQVGRGVEILDENTVGDELWGELEDNKEDRTAIIRRLGYVANLLSRNGVAVLVAALSPYKASREENRRMIARYVEVYVDCPTEKLIERDGSGKYKKALSGEIPNFVGITEPYEPPASPEVSIHSDQESVEEGARKIFQALLDLGYVSAEDILVITGKRGKLTSAAGKARTEKAPAKGTRKARPVARAARVAKAAKKAAARRRAR
jgi:adenylylsulfate kinase